MQKVRFGNSPSNSRGLAIFHNSKFLHLFMQHGGHMAWLEWIWRGLDLKANKSVTRLKSTPSENQVQGSCARPIFPHSFSEVLNSPLLWNTSSLWYCTEYHLRTDPWYMKNLHKRIFRSPHYPHQNTCVDEVMAQFIIPMYYYWYPQFAITS